MNQRDQGKTEIEEILSRRGSQYTHAIVRGALALGQDGQWENCIMSVEFSDGEPVESRSLVYRGFEIHVLAKRPEEILKLIVGLINENKFQMADRDISLKNGVFHRLGLRQRLGRRLSGGEAWGGWTIPNEWPGDLFVFSAEREIYPPSDPLVGLDMPVYPDGFAAIEHILRVDARGGRMWDGGVVFFFPDYRAKIENVTLGLESLTVKIGLRISELSELAGKVYARSKKSDTLHKNIEFHTIKKWCRLAFKRRVRMFACFANLTAKF